MFDLDDLILPSRQEKMVKGKWCTIALRPSLHTGERLNIGVAFVPGRGKARARLITSAAGFRSLYGNNGVDNFSFLLAVTAESIQRTGCLLHVSPHVEFGPLKPAKGESVDAILDSLFQTIVTLRIPEESNTTNAKTVNTQKLRGAIIRQLRKSHASSADRYLHEQPVVINFENRPHLLDLPVWQSEDLVSGRLFGSIVSAHYADEIYRQHDLDRAFRNLDTAKRFITNDGRGAMFILRPASNDGAFPVRDIDNDIDAVAWPLSKTGIRIEVEDSVSAVERKVANFICG